jgi:putative FmdB family regulatory protein
MPIYEYRCDNGHTFEVLQKFSDDPLEKCEVCGAPARRVLHPVAIHFKGSGFYTTDYGRGKTAAKADGSSTSSGDGGGDSARPSSGGSGTESTPKKAAEA